MDFGILGRIEATQAGDPIELGSPRQRAVFARLLMASNEVVTTDRLIDDLWSGEPPRSARHTLHVYISGLRKALGPEAERLEHDGIGYRLVVGPGELDATRFERLAAEGRSALARRDPTRAVDRLRAALDQWRGPAMADVADEPFAREEAIRLEELRLGTLEQRIQADLELGRHLEVIEELSELVAQHPFRETLWEQLMLALYRAGRQAEALRTYQAVRANLAAELGIEPGPALRRLEDQILSQDPSLDPGPASLPEAIPSSLPSERTSFIGRSRELDLGATLLGRSRLLTLTGAPGSGKTRLALRLAGDCAPAYPHGAFFVPLAPIRNPRRWDTAVGRELGLREVPGESALHGLQAFFRGRRALLILDNFEQILRAAPHVGELLDAAPDLTILVTSRAPLGLSGEQEFLVPPLETPPAGIASDPDAVGRYDAVGLFVARAQAVDPDFRLTPSNASAVAAVTNRLDGLPLAIELAAARIKVLTPQQLQARLEQRLALLTEGPADTADRHHTMRDAIAWSYELLEPADQDFFRRLGAFVGGFTLEAAAAVGDITDGEAIDRVGALLSKSLLYRSTDTGQARFAMLEMTREFAWEELTAAGEQAEMRARHARFFLDLGREVEPQLTQEPQGKGTARLSPEVPNLRAALRYGLEQHRDLGLELASCLWRFWQASDQLVEGREWLERLLAIPGASDTSRVKGTVALAGLAYWMADYDEALRHYAVALSHYRATGDRFNEADTLYAMSLTAGWQLDLDAAARYADEARAIFEKLESREGVGRALVAQAFVLWKRDDLVGARDLWEEALAISREAGDVALASTQLVGLASLTYHLGDREEAMRIVLEGVREATELQNVHVTVWMLDFVAAFAVDVAAERAVRLAGAVAAMRQEAGGGILPASLDVEDAKAAAAEALAPRAIDRAWLDGQGMALDDALDLAFELGEAVAAHNEAAATR